MPVEQTLGQVFRGLEYPLITGTYGSRWLLGECSIPVMNATGVADGCYGCITEGRSLMTWSFPIGSVKGTVIRIHVTFLLFLLWIGGAHYALEGEGCPIGFCPDSGSARFKPARCRCLLRALP